MSAHGRFRRSSHVPSLARSPADGPAGAGRSGREPGGTGPAFLGPRAVPRGHRDPAGFPPRRPAPGVAGDRRPAARRENVSPAVPERDPDPRRPEPLLGPGTPDER